jgi:exonuclease VII large subunit
MADTKPESKDTSEEDGKKPEGKEEGADTDKAKKDQDAPKFTQKDQDALAAKVRKEEKEKYEKQVAKQKQEADEAKAKEQGEFEKLANERQTKIEELEPQLEAANTELAAYKEKVSELVKADLKALPDEVKEISPAKYAEDKSLTNPLEILAWLPKGKALAEKLNGQPAKPGMKTDPKSTGNAGDAEKEKAAKASQGRMYSRF